MAHILLVDDDDTMRGLIASVLRRAGHSVSDADSGRAAIDLLGTTDAGLVVTDINMPTMDGIELILELRRLRPGLPIIAISGGGLMPKELLLENADLLGAVDTISKPLESGQLLDAVERALAAPPPGDGSTD